MKPRVAFAVTKRVRNEDMADFRKIKIPESVFDEVGEGNDGLAQWIKQNKEHFFIPKDDAYTHMPAVMDAYVKRMSGMFFDFKRYGNLVP